MSLDAAKSQQLPSSMVEKELGEVNIRREGSALHVEFTMSVQLEGEQAEGWKTGVALDASASMRNWYGKLLKGSVPPEIMAEYEQRGWVTKKNVDGRVVKNLQKIAHDDAIQRGFVAPSENIVEPLAREFISYLASSLDDKRGTTVVYWACGDGSDFEVMGDFTAEQCKRLPIHGPKQYPFGAGTYLVPALHYFCERFVAARRGMFVFLTDGKLDDLDDVKRYSTELAQLIASGKRNYVKCVLIGIGEHIDEKQMEELDDLETGTGVDLWDHKIAREMRDLKDIFAEVVDEHQIVAERAKIYDSFGEPVKVFGNGMPARVAFHMAASSPYFDLELSGRRIRQSVDLRTAQVVPRSGWYESASAGRAKPTAPIVKVREEGPRNVRAGATPAAVAPKVAPTPARATPQPASSATGEAMLIEQIERALGVRV
jgi:hypothetical protein